MKTSHFAGRQGRFKNGTRTGSSACFGLSINFGRTWLPALLFSRFAESALARRKWFTGSALAALIGALIWNPVRGQVNQSVADFHPVDLSMSYSRKPDTFEAGTAWSAVPWGRQRLDGIPFRLGGILELTGMGAAGDGWVYPGGYTGIRVARKAEWIHLLHGTGYDEKDGVAIARLTLNYENGEKRSLDIRYGVHVRNWWVEKQEKVAAVSDPNSKVAWTGTSRQTDPAGVTLRLFHSSLQNPLPDQPIQSVDFSSLFRRATPVIVAMTVGKAGNARPVAAAAPALAKVETELLEEAGLRAETLLHLEDAASGKPVANARLRLNVENEKGSYYFGEQSTDATGTTSVAYPTSLFTRLTLAVMAPGYATLFHNASIHDLNKDVVLKLTRGIAVGGLVKDPVGKPVADAKVVVSAVARDEAGQFVLSEYDTVASDASGKWFSSSLPADFKSLSLEVTHPRFMPTEFEQAESDDPADKKFSRESLLAGRVLLVVEPGIAVQGSVADTAGKPLAGAEVALSDLSEPPKKQITRTDAKGGFSFVCTQLGEFHLIAKAKAFAPGHQLVEVERGLKPVVFRLNQSKAFKGRVVDNTGKPVEGATVALQSWNELPLLSWSTTTDAEGRFSWESAPEGTANYSASKPGYNSVSFGPDGSEEQTITMTQAFQISGTVVDADTREPIRDFKIVPGSVWPMADQEQVNWEFQHEKPSSAGKYSMTLEPATGMVGERVRFMVRAEGYLPAASPLFPNTGWHTHDFELKKGSGPLGIVVSQEGQRVAEAEVALLGAGYLNLGKAAFKRVGPRNDFLVKTDAEGRFSLPAALPAPRVVAVHEQGYAEIAEEELARTGKIVLQPWGRVEGILKYGTRPGTNEEVMIAPRQTGPGGMQYDFEIFKTRTDDHGRFTFDYLPPGPRQLVSLVPMGPPTRGWMWGQIQPIEVKAGLPTQVVYGGVGRPVSGRLDLSDPNRKVDWNSGHHSFGTKFPRPPRRLKTAEEAQEWNNSPEVKEARKNNRYYGLRIAEDGSFRLENVLPGTYQLSINLNEPGANQFSLGPSVASMTRDVVVADIPGGVSDEPLDLGVLTLQLKADLKAGDPAPGFEVKTLDGKPLKLSDFRGRFVLLDFWATWCGPCVAELPNMKQTYEAFAKDPRFAMIGLSLDAETKEAQDFVQNRELKWIQGSLGEWSQTKLPDQYGVNGIPATFLIGPEGRIIAKDLRGAAIREAVAKALGQESKASAN